MSRTTLEEIIGRLVLDPEFRRQMAASREQALAGYELTLDERASLDSLNLAELEGAASALEERISKGITAN